MPVSHCVYKLCVLLWVLETTLSWKKCTEFEINDVRSYELAQHENGHCYLQNNTWRVKKHVYKQIKHPKEYLSSARDDATNHRITGTKTVRPTSGFNDNQSALCSLQRRSTVYVSLSCRLGYRLQAASTMVMCIVQWAVMLNEAKISKPRPRPRPGPWGWSQSFEVKAEANFLTSRPGRGQR